MSISRRGALLGATAAVAVAGVPTAVVAKAALAGDPVLPAFEAYEAARLQAIAMSDYRLTVVEAVKAELPPEPHPNQTYLDFSPAEDDEAREWRAECGRRVTARLGMDEDSFMDIYYNRTMLAYEAVADIRATTVAGLLCQVRAWWSTYEGHSNIQIPDPEESPWEPQTVVQRLYHDLERLAGEARP